MADYFNVAFDESQYRSVNLKAAKYYLEKSKSGAIPLVQTDLPDADVYRHPLFLEPNIGGAGESWTEVGPLATVISNYIDVDLFTQQCNLQTDLNDINRFSESFISDKHDALIEAWAYRVDYNNFHGPHNDTGVQMVEGLLGQLTTIENLSSAADHNCNIKGDIYLWIKGMIEDIPFGMRESGPDMLMYINEKTYTEAKELDRIYNDKNEWQLIMDNFVGEDAVHGQKIGKVIVTDMINALAADDTDGNGADGLDTLGTDGRILIMVPDDRWVGRVVSRGFSLLGTRQGAITEDQLFGWKGRAYFFDVDCANYSERLAF